MSCEVAKRFASADPQIEQHISNLHSSLGNACSAVIFLRIWAVLTSTAAAKIQRAGGLCMALNQHAEHRGRFS